MQIKKDNDGKIIISGDGSTMATKNKVLITNSCLEPLVEVEINDDGSGLVIYPIKQKGFQVKDK